MRPVVLFLLLVLGNASFACNPVKTFTNRELTRAVIEKNVFVFGEKIPDEMQKFYRRVRRGTVVPGVDWSQVPKSYPEERMPYLVFAEGVTHPVGLIEWQLDEGRAIATVHYFVGDGTTRKTILIWYQVRAPFHVWHRFDLDP